MSSQGSLTIKLSIPPSQVPNLDAKAKQRGMNRSEYVRWCIANASESTNLSRIVENMTVEELAKMGKVSVSELVRWAMTPEPPPVNLKLVKDEPKPKVLAKPVAKKTTKKPTNIAKEQAKKQDEKLLQDKLKE